MTKRLAAMGQEKYQGLAGNGHFNGVLKTWTGELSIPLRWRKPRLVFVNSMSDLFHKDVPFEFIAKCFAVMALAERHTFQILTKRPERAAEFLEWVKLQWPKLFPHGVPDYAMDANAVLQFLSDEEAGCEVSAEVDAPAWPLPNVWLGTSVEDQANVELDEVEAIEDYIATELERLGYDPDTVEVRIPTAIASDWYRKATNDFKIANVAVGRRLGQMIGEGQIHRLAKDPSHKHGRAFIWTGANWEPFIEMKDDLLERIEDHRSNDWRGKR